MGRAMSMSEVHHGGTFAPPASECCMYNTEILDLTHRLQSRQCPIEWIGLVYTVFCPQKAPENDMPIISTEAPLTGSRQTPKFVN